MRSRSIQKVALFSTIASLLLAIIFVPIWVQWFRLRNSFDLYASQLVSQDYQKAFLSTSDSFRTVTPVSSFVSQQQSLVKSNGRLKAVTRLNTHVYADPWPTSWRGTIYAQLRYEACDLLLAYTFVREDGEWKILAYTSGASG
jgi:hypothetical protein